MPATSLSQHALFGQRDLTDGDAIGDRVHLRLLVTYELHVHPNELANAGVGGIRWIVGLIAKSARLARARK
jgi:hypothetical protein